MFKSNNVFYYIDKLRNLFFSVSKRKCFCGFKKCYVRITVTNLHYTFILTQRELSKQHKFH